MITIAYVHEGTAVGFDATGTLRYNGPVEGMPECRCVVKGDTAKRMVGCNPKKTACLVKGDTAKRMVEECKAK